MPNHYERLGVPVNANDAAIKTAFRQLSKKYHPDKHGGEAFYEEQFKLVLQAYEVLKHPEKRQAYNLEMGLSSGATAESTRPVIQAFEVSKTVLRAGETVWVSWHVSKADEVVLKPFGQVDHRGEKKVRFTNFKGRQRISLVLQARDFLNEQVVEQRIDLFDQDYRPPAPPRAEPAPEPPPATEPAETEDATTPPQYAAHDLTAQFVYPAFTERLLALALDGLLLSIVFLLADTLFSLVFNKAYTWFELPLLGAVGPRGIFKALAALAWFTFTEGSVQAASPGKRMGGLKVVNRAGKPLNWQRALARNLLKLLIALPLGLGLWLSKKHPQQRSWADRLTGAYVIGAGTLRKNLG